MVNVLGAFLLTSKILFLQKARLRDKNAVASVLFLLENELCSQIVCLTQSNEIGIIGSIRTVQKRSVKWEKNQTIRHRRRKKGGFFYERLRSH